LLIAQSYAAPSSATVAEYALGLSLSTELGRPGVTLDATVRNSRGFALAMLALHKVVAADLRRRQRDHSAYQAWLASRYQERLVERIGKSEAEIAALHARRAALEPAIADLQGKLWDADFGRVLDKLPAFAAARQKYFDHLYKSDREAWIVLDPVVSVHPDATIFEVFSQDESSYGRVTVPMDLLERHAEPTYGTTNVDYSTALRDEISRARSYRPASLRIGSGAVAIGTSGGERIERKIDLPPTWVAGFLQVQSAGGMPATTVTISSPALAAVLWHLRRRRERTGPRSLKIGFAPGEPATIEIEPFGIVVTDHGRRHDGPTAGMVRIWGRRRLFVLEGLLADTSLVTVRLFGDGLPSFWSANLGGHVFEVGLSGWTANDWSSAARFDLVAATAEVDAGIISDVSALLERRLLLDPAAAAAALSIPQPAAAAALQQLCSRGDAMFDPVVDAYRWRKLLPTAALSSRRGVDPRLVTARRLVRRGLVEAAGEPEPAGEDTLHRFRVAGAPARDVVLVLDPDGRATRIECTCGTFRRGGMTRGPCIHIVAATMFMQSRARAAAARGEEHAGPVAGRGSGP